MTILEILKRAEGEIREAIAEAARLGDYHTVEVGRDAAVGIQDLCEFISDDEEEPTQPSEINKEIVTRKVHKKHTRRGKPEGYPKIEIRKNYLYRIGWSKKQKQEYEHNVMRAEFETMVNTMSALAKEGSGPFMAQAIIDKISATKEKAIPAYQVYVVLAALCEWNLITKVGRDGYNIPTDVAEKAKNKWSELSNSK